MWSSLDLLLTSVMQKNVPSTVVIHYFAWYVFLRDRRYNEEMIVSTRSKNDNLLYNLLGCQVSGTIVSLTKCLMFQVLSFFIIFWTFFAKVLSIYNFTRIRIIILRPSGAWLIRQLTQQPSILNPSYYIEDCWISYMVSCPAGTRNLERYIILPSFISSHDANGCSSTWTRPFQIHTKSNQWTSRFRLSRSILRFDLRTTWPLQSVSCSVHNY